MDTYLYDLEEWLETATRGLRDASRERIRDEMIEHFEAARDDAMRDGAGELTAERLALASLGNAREAHRHFRREHFTAAEALAYLGEDSEAHERAYARSQAIFFSVFGVIAVFATRMILFDSSNAGQGVLGMIGALLGTMLGVLLMFCIPGLQAHVVNRIVRQVKDRDPRTTLRTNRVAAKVWLVIGFTGVVATTIAMVVVFRNGHALAPMPGFLGDAGAVATGANLLLLLTAISAFASLRQCARITRLLDKESKPNAHE